MPDDQTPTALSRGQSVQRSVATAGTTVATVGTLSAASASAQNGAGPAATDPPIITFVAATVVRASHSRERAGSLALGVRASILTPDGNREGILVVVDPVDFGLPTAQVNTQIAEAVRAKVAELLARRTQSLDSKDIAVQVFGGAL